MYAYFIWRKCIIWVNQLNNQNLQAEYTETADMCRNAPFWTTLLVHLVKTIAFFNVNDNDQLEAMSAIKEK